ncbi:MAG TPA: class I SAM-dependent methyltransferase [Phycisphaerae bacterium]|nr:class I SAM-dependent methyltransferase [Phycisphaerae bacterium]
MSVRKVPNPARVVNSLAAFQMSSALRTAIEIDLFTSIGEGHNTAVLLAARCGADVRGIRILADYMVIQGFLGKQGEQYVLAEEALHYLDRRSPNYLGAPVEFVQAPFVRAQFDRLTECVKHGGADRHASALEPNHEMWVRFARVMGAQMTVEARALVPRLKNLPAPFGRRYLRVLDLAAGHGMFGITFAKDDPGCRVVAQDWPAILEVTRENAQKHGVAAQLTTLPGNVLDVEFGEGFDLVLIPNLLHHFDRATNVALLKKGKAALAPGGIAAAVEYAPDENRILPTLHGAFALFLLATTPGGDAYTIGELGAMYEEAGFEHLSACELGIQRLVVGFKPREALGTAA